MNKWSFYFFMTVQQCSSEIYRTASKFTTICFFFCFSDETLRNIRFRSDSYKILSICPIILSEYDIYIRASINEGPERSKAALSAAVTSSHEEQAVARIPIP